MASLLDVPLVQASQNVVPVAVTASDKIESLRQWASGRCLSADRAGVYSREQQAPIGGPLRRKESPDHSSLLDSCASPPATVDGVQRSSAIVDRRHEPPPRFGADRMSSNERSEARSVILRLRRYRDRIEEITRGDGGGVAADTPAGVTAQRRLASLKNDLDHDSHECEIGRKRAVQSDCEQRFLWPALREAAGAMMEQPGTRLLDARAKEELRAARTHILNYLTQLEGLYPTL